MSFYQSAVFTTNAIGAWELYIMIRQRRSYMHNRVPEPFKNHIAQDEFEKNQSYGKDRAAQGILGHVKDVVISNAVLLWKLPAKIFRCIAARAPVTDGSFAHCLLFSVATDVLSTLINLPFEYYSHFVVEAKHGFNRMTRKDFFKDQLLSLALRIALLHPAQAGLIYFIVRKFGERFPLYLFSGISALVFLFMFLYPNFIQPLFNTFTPLEEQSALYGKIKKLADSVSFPLTKVFIVDGSRRSSHSNAYLYGFWKNKRIVLYDTLIEQMKEDDEQILAVLCHELGHWQHGHTKRLIGITLLQLLAFVYGAKAVIFNPDIYGQFGFEGMNPVIGFELFSVVFLKPASTLIGYGIASLTRIFEFQADAFATGKGYGPALRKGLVVMVKENKAGLTPDPLYSALKYTHPPTIERLNAIEEEEKKRQ